MHHNVGGNRLLTSRRPVVDDADMGKDAILHMRLEVAEKSALDDLRRAEPNLPSRSEMVRRLIQRALDAQKRERKK